MSFHCKANETVLRLILIGFSYVFALLSVALVALGVVYLNDIWWPKQYVGSEFANIPIMLIVLGTLSFMTSIVGCYISRIKSKRSLRIFILCLSILLALELTVALISFFNINEDSRNVTKSILRFELLESNKTIAHFHEIEKHYKCCGVESAFDYPNLSALPDTCCWENCTDVYQMHTDGCLDKIMEYVQELALEIGLYSFCYTLLQVSEIICLFFLCQA